MIAICFTNSSGGFSHQRTTYDVNFHRKVYSSFTEGIGAYICYWQAQYPAFSNITALFIRNFVPPLGRSCVEISGDDHGGSRTFV